jgi:hypothetical protein
MEDKTTSWGRVGDSAIMPSVTVQIPMPPGAATPAQPASVPAQSAPVAPAHNADSGA